MTSKKPAPFSLRQTFKLFEFYREELGLGGLFEDIDLSTVSPRQVSYAVHGRAPDCLAAALDDRNHSPLALFLAALASDEFRHKLVSRFLAAFPEKKRLIFVHIPGCPGTDLSSHLITRHPNLNIRLLEPALTASAELFRALKNFVSELNVADTFYIHGHAPLSTYENWGAIRFEDRVFSTIRDPGELVISRINYVLARIFSLEEPISPDTHGWRKEFNVENLDFASSTSEVSKLARAILRHKGTIVPNRICQFFGDGSYDSAVERVTSHDVEITSLACYKIWCRDRWGFEAAMGMNESSKQFIQRDDLSAEENEYIESITSEDRKFHRRVLDAISERGGSSIVGRQILPASFQFSALPEAEPENTPRHDGTPSDNAGSKHSHGAANVARAHQGVEIAFGIKGNSGEFLQGGWSSAEEGFTWTDGTECRLTIPRPLLAATYLLRTKVVPFVSGEKLLAQRISLTINGDVVGEALVREIAVLEFRVPWETLEHTSLAMLCFSLPDAARPSDFQALQDTRRLAFAFEWLKLVNLQPPTGAIPDAFSTAAAEEARKVPAKDLMMKFESLGQNCEFGLVQRRCDAEPLGLLRFSSSPLPKLLAALDSRFAGMGNSNSVEIQVSPNGKEYMVQDLRFGLYYHAFVLVGEHPPETVHKRECRRVPFLIQKLIEDLTTAEKIFVFHGMSPLSTGDALDLRSAIRKYGPGTLLWVEVADPEHSPGTVEWVVPGLLKAYIDRFAPSENAHDLSLSTWVAICRAAYRLLLLESSVLRAPSASYEPA